MSLKWDEEAARAEEREKERITSIRNLMETVGRTAQQAMDALKIPATEQARYAALVQP